MPTFSITRRWAEPFYRGGGVSLEVPYPYPVAIDGRPYLIEVAEYRRTTLRPMREATDDSQEPGEQSFTNEGPWRRTQGDWTLGAGQRFFDRDQVSRRRFRTSKGMDVWTRHQLTLLHSTAQKRTLSSATPLLLTVVSAAGTRYLYVADGANLHFTTNPEADSPTWTAVTHGGTGNVVDLSSNGDLLFVTMDGGNIRSLAVGATGSGSNFGTGTSQTFGQYVNGRFLSAGATAALNETTGGGTTTAVFTHPFSGFRWRGAVAAPNGIYAWGDGGSDRSEIYFINVDDTGALTVPRLVSGGWPDGELLYSLVPYAGFMFAGTSRGVRLMAVSNEALNLLSLIAVSNPVRCLEAQGEFIWFGWTNYDSTSTGLGRVNLNRFSDENTPAYASDLMADVQGVVTSVATYGDRRYFTVASGHVHGETGSYVSSGTLTSGWIGYGNYERKIPTSMDLRHEPLVDGSVSLSLAAEDQVVALVGTSSSVGSTGTDPFDISGFDGEQMEVTVTLNRGATLTNTPVLLRWTLRSMMAPFVSEEIILPLIIHEEIATGVGERVHRPLNTLYEYQFLSNLVTSKRRVVFQEGFASYDVYVTGLEVRPYKLDDGDGFYEGLVLVRLITLDSRS